MEPSRITSMKGVPIVAVCGGAAAAHAIAIAEDGRVFAWCVLCHTGPHTTALAW